MPAPLSIYEGISKLPAAHTLTLENGEVKVERYWRLSYKTREPVPSVADAAEQLRELLADSVRMRLVSDVPLGVLLSGGIDSSVVTALAVRASSETVKTFSISFAESSFRRMRITPGPSLSSSGTDHHEERLSVSLAAGPTWSAKSAPLDGRFDQRSLAGPDISALAFHAQARDGGAGWRRRGRNLCRYPMYFGHHMARAYKRVPGFLRRGLIEPVVNHLLG